MVLGLQYVKGLFQGQKRNIERMVERVTESEYYSLQHFISESPWDARKGFDQVATDTSHLFESYASVGLLIDESSHRKKGNKSVGVSRQYCGTIGKVDNCQVAVYGALSTQKYYGLIDVALYLPQSWIENPQRCKQAKVPKERLQYKSKPELAMEIIKHQKQLGTRFDFVSADGLYGNSYWFQDELDKLGQLFVLDVHEDQYVYISCPEIFVPDKRKGARGRQPTRYKTEATPIEVRDITSNLQQQQWEPIMLRKTGKGDLKCLGYVQKVYTWDGVSPYSKERLLIIRGTENKEEGSMEYKYALSNAAEEQFTTEQLVGMQSQRFFVERNFQDVKQDAGMSQYQVRGWLAWHHHMALVMMAGHFILSEKLLFKEEFPLLSAYDVREIILNTYSRKGTTTDEIIQQMLKRHDQRQFKNTPNNSS
jgi:SRSO17 transposase